MTRYLLITIALLGWTVASTQTIDTISMDQLLERAEQQALARFAAERDQEIARLDEQLLRANLRPQLTLTGNVPNYLQSFSEIVQPDGTVRFQSVRNNNSALGLNFEQVIPQTGGVLFAQSNLQRFDDFESGANFYNGLPIRIGISQPILGFNPWRYDRQLAALRTQEAEAAYQLQLDLIRTEITQLFFDLLLAEREGRIAATNYEANERLFSIAEERYELGKISRRDLVQLELELLSAQRAQISSDQAIMLASAAIADYLGESAGDYGYRTENPDVLPESQLDETQLIQRVRAHRPEWIGFERRRLENDKAQARARRENGPQISLLAAAGRARSSEQLNDIYSDPQPEAFVQVQLSVPILDGGRRRHAVERATVDAAYTATAVQREAQSLENTARQALQRYRRLSQELTLAERVGELAEERFAITTESYILGAIPLAELTLAQREKDQAVRSYAQTQRNAWIAWTQLQALAGTD